MNVLSRLLLSGGVVLTATCCVGDDENPLKDVFTLYDGFQNDQTALRKTVRLKVTNARTDTVNASSAEACHAARRVFGRVSFLFKNRDDALKLLGDPATISDYNNKMKPGPNNSLVYVFDSGLGGWRYTLNFRNDECIGIEAESLD